MDERDLRKFMKLPPVFTRDVMNQIEIAVAEYDDYVATISQRLESVGGDYGFKNAKAYNAIRDEIKGGTFSDYSRKRYLAVIAEMKAEYCGR